MPSRRLLPLCLLAGCTLNDLPAPPPAAPDAPPAAAPAQTEPKTSNYDLQLPDGRKLRLHGIELDLVDTDGNLTPAPDGDYVTTDGKVLAAANGRIRGLR